MQNLISTISDPIYAGHGLESGWDSGESRVRPASHFDQGAIFGRFADLLWRLAHARDTGVLRSLLGTSVHV